ncbi:MAG: RNA-binding protein [Azospirillaceae bacterium]
MSDLTITSAQATGGVPNGTAVPGPAADPAAPTRARPEPRGPWRRCLVTRSVRPKTALVRFVVAPDGTVTPDIEEKLPGRGLWVRADRATLASAVRKGRFAKAAGGPVTTPPDLVERVEALLERRCLAILSLARGAGHAVSGLHKVRERLEAGRAVVLFEARDGSEDGFRRLAGLAASSGVPVVRVLGSDALGEAFGRGSAVHVAVGPGGLAERLLVEAGRLDGMRSDGEDAPAVKG